MRESASTDLREPQGSNPLGPPGPELPGPASLFLLTGIKAIAILNVIPTPARL
jgi:hypothetical protein